MLRLESLRSVVDEEALLVDFVLVAIIDLIASCPFSLALIFLAFSFALAFSMTAELSFLKAKSSIFR